MEKEDGGLGEREMDGKKGKREEEREKREREEGRKWGEMAGWVGCVREDSLVQPGTTTRPLL